MNPTPPMDAPEVTRLSLRWLDGLATDAERCKLFAVLAADPAAACEFARLARFEHLLASVCHDRAEQALVVAATARQQVKHQRRQRVWTGLKAAAVLLFVGPLLWLAWPEPEPPQLVSAPRQPLKTLPRSRPPSPRAPSRSEVRQVAQPTAPAVPQPSLEDRLRAFYLPPMHFDQVTLADALHQIESQLRAINRNADSDLSRLLMQMPAAAAQQRITFDSPGMAVLPLVRTVAGLAGCEVQLSLITGHLVLNQSSQETQRVLRSYDLPTTPEDLEKAHQVARDAQAVGIDTSTWEQREDGQRIPPTVLNATTGQLRALDAIGATRADLAHLAPVRVRALVVPRLPGNENRELTPRERDEYLLKSESQPDSTFAVQPGRETVLPSPPSPYRQQVPTVVILQPQLFGNGLVTPQPSVANPTPQRSGSTLTLTAVRTGTTTAVTLVNYAEVSAAGGMVASSTGGLFNYGASTTLRVSADSFGSVVQLNATSSLVVVPVP